MSGTRSIDLPGRPLQILPASLPRASAVVLLGLLTAAALMVVARRLAGALANPLEPATLLTTGILVAAAAVAIRLGWFLSPATFAANSSLRRTPPHCNGGDGIGGIDSRKVNRSMPRLDRAVMVLTSL